LKRDRAIFAETSATRGTPCYFTVSFERGCARRCGLPGPPLDQHASESCIHFPELCGCVLPAIYGL